jgi:hypothetical protein
METKNLNRSDVIHSEISDFKPWVVAGFSLSGYKVENGYVLGDKNGDFVKELPNEILCNSVVYALENIEVFGNDFFNAHYV